MKSWGVVDFFKDLVFQQNSDYVGLSRLKNTEENTPKMPSIPKKARKDVKISDLMKGNISDY
ncbi:MAG: hypothetical protein WCK67_07435 [bacterium]